LVSGRGQHTRGNRPRLNRFYPVDKGLLERASDPVVEPVHRHEEVVAREPLEQGSPAPRVKVAPSARGEAS